jgi:hypothetical protein
MQGVSSTLPSFIKNSDSLIMGIVLSNKLFKVIIQNTSPELLNLNKMQFNNMYIQIAI